MAVTIQGSIGNTPKYGSYTGFAHLAAGLCCGLSGLTAGMSDRKTDVGSEGTNSNPRYTSAVRTRINS
ncbi:hypothetical protein PR003_g32039 [Phytophthora rubi]|uniref:Uncharacterized protein n=1 Tax=Phytophthora rubi TaxID=129364 RepID=A0A6A4B294_9STRA|nr:hypothetical protein PR003_g32039 [Phytophthora rubi]